MEVGEGRRGKGERKKEKGGRSSEKVSERR